MRWGGDDSPFALLRSLEEEELSFLVVPPAAFFADYEFELEDATAERLGLEHPSDALVLVIVTVGDDVATATANLMGPIVINRHNRQAVQAVLTRSGYSLRTPLVGASAG